MIKSFNIKKYLKEHTIITGTYNQKDIVVKQKIAYSDIHIVLKESRSLNIIAYDIQQDWKNVNYGAKPYLQAMYSLDKISDAYGQDSARSVVAYFLSNASSWRGETAKKIKLELKKLLK